MNGGVTWKWVAATLLAILLLISGAAFTGIENRLNTLEQMHLDIIQRLARIEVSIGRIEKPTVRTFDSPRDR